MINLKKQQESEIKFLKDKIKFLENLLKAKNNVDYYKKGLESFSGSVIEMPCFGKNQTKKYFDLKLDYSDLKKIIIIKIQIVLPLYLNIKMIKIYL